MVMAKGQESKSNIMKILTTMFGDKAFIASDNKTLRVSCIENGEPVEIKIALTAAKDLERSGSSAAAADDGGVLNFSDTPSVDDLQITEEEKENLRKMIEELGI
jgi:hypothetical protein